MVGGFSASVSHGYMIGGFEMENKSKKKAKPDGLASLSGVRKINWFLST
jgi:hypothetical protein